ncbi:DUF2162 family putative transporter [Desulfotignum balticum]|jgi:predicted transporter|uniref:DUF2162 family putative transporter n=1 Tax=Desulfotignum balticum TaxID=115781 RepID=UPI0004173C72|nr:DUF2162 family putative transporter [Desulfotignum balticum]
MEEKTLILGLVMSFAAFAVKAGGGLAYLFLQQRRMPVRAVAALGFALVYAVVFSAVWLVLINVDLMAHLALLQTFFASGMALHVLLALFLTVWGAILLTGNRRQSGISRGWLALVIPCPVCFSVMVLSCAFVHALYPGDSLVFTGLFLGFILISLGFAAAFAALAGQRRHPDTFLGILMLYIAMYFMLSVMILPHVEDLERIYRISLFTEPHRLSAQEGVVLGICLAALAAGLIKPLKRE